MKFRDKTLWLPIAFIAVVLWNVGYFLDAFGEEAADAVAEAVAAPPLPTPNDETDDTAALQAWILQQKDPLQPRVALPPGKFIVTESLVVYRSMGLKLSGGGSLNRSTNTGWDRYRCGSILEWRGPADKPIFVLSRCTGLTLEGLNFVVADGHDTPQCILVKHGGGATQFAFRDMGFIGGRVGIQFATQQGEQTCANATLDNTFFEQQTEACVRIMNTQGLEYLFLRPEFNYSPLAIDVVHGGDVQVLGGGTYELGALLRLGTVSQNTRGFNVTGMRFDGSGKRTAWLTFADTDRAKTYGCVTFANCSQNNGQREADVPLITVAPGCRCVARECSFNGSFNNWAALYSDNRASSELVVENSDGLDSSQFETLVEAKGNRAYYAFVRSGNLYTPTRTVSTFPGEG